MLDSYTYEAPVSDVTSMEQHSYDPGRAQCATHAPALSSSCAAQASVLSFVPDWGLQQALVQAVS